MRDRHDVVWVVGASGGLGRAIAHAFLARGATTILSGRNKAALTQLADTPGLAGSAIALPVDVTDAASVDGAAEAIIARCRRIDTLVNTTSVSAFGDFLTMDDDAWRRIYEAKLFAYVRTMRAVLPHMIGRQRGAIVNVSGSGGKYPNFPSHIAGTSGNAAVNLVTKAIADRYFDQGIRANCVAPGPIRSKRFDTMAAADAVVVGGEAAKPRPPGEPEDVAAAVLFLASERSRHINGTVLTVDGGETPTVI